MVCGGMGMAYRNPLYRVQGIMTSVGYRDNIVQPVILSALQAMKPGDNDRPHRILDANDSVQLYQVNQMTSKVI